MDKFLRFGGLAAAAALPWLAACGTGMPTSAPRAPVPAISAASGAALIGARGVPSPCQMRAEEALRLVNQVRAAGRRCGARSMPPAPPLRWDAALQSAAEAHARDMASRNYFDHRGPGGPTVRDRVRAARYASRDLGENIAAGSHDIAETMQGWVASPGHCENLMEPNFADVAVACVAQPGSAWGTYWTMVLGRR